MVELHHASMLDWLADYEGPQFDSCVTDPPYHLASIVARFGKEGSAPVNNAGTKAGRDGDPYARAARGFMGKEWDGGDIAFRPETWRAVYDALKPGAHLVAFSGTRTYHRMACAIEDAGFEIRDQLAWMYGSGFPKSHNISKGIDKAAGAKGHDSVGFNVAGKGSGLGTIQRPELRSDHPDYVKPQAITPEAEQWQGWGTAIKPAWEPICLARKPLSEKTVAANVLKHGTGAINIDACRVGMDGGTTRSGASPETTAAGWNTGHSIEKLNSGRFPANIIHDGSDEVLAEFPESTDGVAGKRSDGVGMFNMGGHDDWGGYGGKGSAARFFYSAKAGPLDRLGSEHATIKPVDLMRWLCRLVTPAGGRILEPFAGSGTTGIAAMVEGFDCTMIEMEADHVADIERKLAHLRGEGVSSIEMHKKRKAKPIETLGGLFKEATNA